MSTYDFNVLEKLADDLQTADRHQDAIAVYLYMANGDKSLDGGRLGFCLAHCYKYLIRIAEAQYWAHRAVQENPSIAVYQQLHGELQTISIEAIVNSQKNQPNSN